MKDEIKHVLDFFKYVYSVFGFQYRLELSTKPEKAMGDDALWETAENSLKEALEEEKLEYKINPGDGAFYGPKIDVHVQDAINRSWQLATIQLDFQLPLRFNATYEGSDGQKHNVVMIHRAILGSLERFIGVLIEHYAGKFPLWLNPTQVKILTISDKHTEYAIKVQTLLRDSMIRAHVDARVESMSKKVREAQLEQYNYILVVGDKEIGNNTVTVRTRNNEVIGAKDVAKFKEELLDEIKKKK